jgi:hypothetical protein
VSLDVCLRWLPVWLPGSGSPAVIQLQIRSPAASEGGSVIFLIGGSYWGPADPAGTQPWTR